MLSPPSRAAWIEIINHAENVSKRLCRRLHGRRGLKWLRMTESLLLRTSPPSRAAWIEIRRLQQALALLAVAAFTGGVD